MSVLIKTMTNLPEHCYECPCHDGESGYCQADEENRYSDYRPFWCPLVEAIEALEQESILDKIKRDVFNACCDNYHMPVYKLDCDEIFEIIDKYKSED